MENNVRPQLNFASLRSPMDVPNLLDIQLRSFDRLVGGEKNKKDQEDWEFAIDRVFRDILPVESPDKKLTLDYVSCSLGQPKYSVEECIERDMTYQTPLKAKLQLTVWSKKPRGKPRAPKYIIEKEVYLGDLPRITELGTFVINGAERVVVSQLHRSPGVVFEEVVHANGSRLPKARVIPFRGSWIEFTIDIHGVCYIHIDRKKKFPVTAMLRALGYGEDGDIYKCFFSAAQMELADDPELARSLEGRTLAEEITGPDGEEVLAEESETLTEELLEKLIRAEVGSVWVYVPPKKPKERVNPIIRNTLAKDPTTNEEHALREIYSLLRSGEAPKTARGLKMARTAIESAFFDSSRYDLGRVGRYKINQRLGMNAPLSDTVLRRDDFVAILKELMRLSDGKGSTDDIDHLGNRRVRTVGELIASQFSLGLFRMARLVRERMSAVRDTSRINIDDLVNARSVSAVIQTFFGSSQLSQFMDQTNPLAEMTHKRRLSALGPGGLTRERAGFEVRDVHYSHYGRMCPVETPEGPNIGLISSLATYARVNELGFVETPYRKVIDGRVTDEIAWLNASDERESTIAQANAPLLEDGSFKRERALCRKLGDFPLERPENIDYIDVAPEQLVSVAAAMIPFLEHDDANRALMGSNMQRQAVPLLYTDAPLVGTGLESRVARDSGAVTVAKRDGRVVSVDASEVVVDTGRVRFRVGQPLAKLARQDRYRMKKFWRTNQDTAINQRPLVSLGQEVKAGDIIADGPSTDHGQLALGRNLRVAFMPWYGHNFEDAIVLSKRLVKDDVFTSIHIQELELHVRDTKRGTEQITREIPNVNDDALLNLDERGIVRIGARVNQDDILCGKITPKGETDLSPEEKLLTAIFGEKAKDVKDSSLRVPSGMSGTVIDVKIFSRRNDDTLLEREHGMRISDLRQQEREEIQRITEARDSELRSLLRRPSPRVKAHTQVIQLCLKHGTVEPFLPAGTVLDAEVLRSIEMAEVDLRSLRVEDDYTNTRISRTVEAAAERIQLVRERTEEQIDKVFQPDELPPGVIQLVKVYLAQKRKVAVGDKMAGRHGNKGIISKIVPAEDMPFLPDGTPVDIILSPLGVPSRMNVGQVLETHLGRAADQLGIEAKTPVFHGANEREVGLLLRLGGARWAAGAISPETPWPLDSGDYRVLVDLDRQYREEGSPGFADESRNGAGPPSRALGVDLDSYVAFASDSGLEKASALLAGVRGFLIEVAEHAARKKGAPVSFVFPKINALRDKADSGGLEAALQELLRSVGTLANGKIWLRDGRTGKRFDHPITVGTIYMLKLSHLVDDKIHSRSIGPYSLVTQQPLAGKAQFGGQRFGEMEVWALEAYGAAHTLQEILTVKSDDVIGRSRVYESIVKGENLPEPGVPESFNVLVKELEGLGLAVQFGSETESRNGD